MVASESDKSIWSHFVSQSEDSTFFHRLDWFDVLRDTFHYDYDLISVYSGAQPIGAMSLFMINSLTKRRMVSHPFSDFGGPLVKEGFEEEFVSTISPKLDALCQKKCVDYILIKHVPGRLLPFFQRYGFTTVPSLCYFTLDLKPSFDAIVRSFEKRVRKTVRDIIGRGLKFEIEDLKRPEDFYETYLVSMRRLGSPPHGIEFFRNLFSKFDAGGGIRLFSCEFENTKVGFMLLLLHRRTAHYYIGSWGTKGLKIGAPSFLQYSTIKWAKENGFDEYNFGRTRIDSGVYLYKRGFGTVARPLNSMIKYFGNNTYFDASSRKFRIASKIISLCPMFLFRFIGPPIKRRLE
jgi:CelD/BcsL family acetyltransferase involved in cellulose biosynthesis